MDLNMCSRSRAGSGHNSLQRAFGTLFHQHAYVSYLFKISSYAASLLWVLVIWIPCYKLQAPFGSSLSLECFLEVKQMPCFLFKLFSNYS